jgi:hypothetical protein
VEHGQPSERQRGEADDAEGDERGGGQEMDVERDVAEVGVVRRE